MHVAIRDNPRLKSAAYETPRRWFDETKDGRKKERITKAIPGASITHLDL